MAKVKYKQPTLFPLTELQDYFVLISPTDEVKKETKKLKNKLYKIIGRTTENEYSVAHISLFKAKFERDNHLLEKLKKALADLKPFAVSTNEAEVFSHGATKKTVYLKIENPKPIQALFESIGEEFKFKKEIVPHLTIEQNLPIADFEKIENDLNAFNYKSEWICDRITVLKRNPIKGTYKLMEEILLQ